MWEAPEDNGGRTDLFYTISQNFTKRIITNNTNITLTGLIPSVHYVLSITSDNGVSLQDNSDAVRTVTRLIMTLEGS